MTQQVIQWVIIAVVVLAQAVLTALKIIEKRNNSAQKELGNNPHPCAKHGERLATLEEGMENIEKRLDRIENKLNGTR